ncbi:unnamed protein product [Peronospora effusa]|nr:unnamed protein product [Peronospora effusa]
MKTGFKITWMRITRVTSGHDEIGKIAKEEAVKIYEDNQGAIALAKNPEFHKRSKHIDVRYHFVREKVEDAHVVLEYCPTQDMLDDIMTMTNTAEQINIL